ncbi:MAG: PilZ domain-containing protein [Planctomycetota bacterium]|jgi:hypothetical protein
MGQRRYPRKIAAWPAWVRFHSSAKYVKGRTENVSRGGAYIVMPVDEKTLENMPVEYILGVPGNEGDHWAIQAVNGEAVVVRIDRGPDGGLALRFLDEKDIG